MRKSILLAILLAISFNIKLKADNGDSTEVRPFQLSFFSPLGTNGIYSYKYYNNLSVNIIAGYNGGLSGIELGGVLNVLRYDMEGVQIAGTGNVVWGNSIGSQLSGVFNFNGGNFEGLQAAGVTNYSTKSNRIIQLAGVNNVIIDTLYGIQLSGTNNFAMGIENGIQGSGVANFNIGSAKGAQIAGTVNLSTDSFEGAQLAGIANINGGNLKGAQISGIANITKTLNGLQLGFINIADSVESGVPIGFASFVVKNGYKTLELSSNESMHFGISFKTGVERFYNIFSVGGRNYNDEFVWGFGYGVGTLLPINEKLNMNIDLISYHLNHNEYWTGEVNNLNKFSINASYSIHKYFTLFAGASLNVHVSRTVDYYGFPVESTPSPLSLYKIEGNKFETNIYPGINFGIRI